MNIKEEFISTLSHEIRTPLTSIKGFLQTLISNWDLLDENKKKEFLKIALNQSNRLIDLVENVLSVAKIDSSEDSFVLLKVDFNKLIDNCIKVIKMNYKDYEFDFIKGKELFCYCDDYKTQQIILNILDNAAKYSINSKKIEIKTYSNKDYNVCSIKNYGSFIEDKDKEKIFDKFYRIDSYLKTTTQGSGLGLYIANNLAKKMRGRIELISDKKDSMVEFLVYLPAFDVEKSTKIIGE